MKTYEELVALKTFKERYEYLKIGGKVGEMTFGGSRHLNQALYSCYEWKRVRDLVVLRDKGCDLAHPDRPIAGRVVIHHLNPITIEDVVQRKPCVFDLDNLVCTTHTTHLAIHYGDEQLLPSDYVERRPNDTCPWK